MPTVYTYVYIQAIKNCGFTSQPNGVSRPSCGKVAVFGTGWPSKTRSYPPCTRGQRPALRCALRRRLHLAVPQLHPGTQVSADEAQHPFVRNASGQQSHQPVELHGIEETYDTLQDLPERVRVTRRHHALEGKVLEVFAKLRHRGKPHFMLVLPDGSRSYIPVAWTDFVGGSDSSAPSCSIVASTTDLLRLRQRVECLLRRIESGSTTNQNSPTQESQYATTATGAVECRTPSDSTNLSTTDASTTQPPRQPSGPTHSQADQSSSRSEEHTSELQS